MVSKSRPAEVLTFPLLLASVDGLNENMKEESRALVNYSSHLWTLDRMAVVGNGSVNLELLCIFILLKMHKDLNMGPDIIQTDLPNKSHTAS